MKQLIVITRPAHQASALVQGIKAAGGDVCLFPTLEIKPTTLSQKEQESIQQINHYDIIIFISPNAVEYGLSHIQASGPFPQDVLIATIGQGSAKSLNNKLGQQADIVPEKNFNSEGLLATPPLQDVKNKRILIIRGNGGREHLKDTLQQRGALVDYINVYQRIKPATASTEIEQHLQNNQIAAIVITSATSLKNLLEMVPEKARLLLLNVPLILINQRLVEVAKEAGFSNTLFITNEASDKAIIETLKQNNLLS